MLLQSNYFYWFATSYSSRKAKGSFILPIWVLNIR